MATYVILSRLSPDACPEPTDLKKLAKTVSDKIKKQCPAVHWKDSYAMLGRFDVVDIVESDDPDQVARAAMIIRAEGHAITETSSAKPWKEFLESL